MPFLNAYKKTMENEGGYSKDPDDSGGETYRGITKKNFPDWEGWKIVDACQPDNLEIIKNDTLEGFVQSFYLKNFWNANKLDQIDLLIPELAERMFDDAVNMGSIRACKFFQQALNLLNKNQQSYPDITVDGNIGPGSINTLKLSLKTNPSKRIVTVFTTLQGCFYIDLMTKNSTQEKFVGWFDRL